MSSGTEKQQIEQAILSAVLWTSPNGSPYTLKNLIADWSSHHAVKQLPGVEKSPEKAAPHIRNRVCTAVRASLDRLQDARTKEARKDKGLITPERRAKGDLLCDSDSDTSGVVTGAQGIDRSIAGRMLTEELLRPEHESAIRRFRAIHEGYTSLFRAKQGAAIDQRATRADERLMADDYLWIRKHQTPLERDLVDFACFTDSAAFNFAAIRRAFDRLVDLFGEMDADHREKETACANPRTVAP